MTVALLAVAMLAIPVLANAMRNKACIYVFSYDLEQETVETKQCRGLTIETVHVTAKLLVIGPAVTTLHLLPKNGTSEGYVTKRFDPETGFGTYTTVQTWDFGDYGSFKTCGSGKCAGYVAAMPPITTSPTTAWICNGNTEGFGKGALRSVHLHLISSTQVNLPKSPAWGIPEDFVDTVGMMLVGEIYY
jgi:hypothetical protein